jgi:predicted transcriptional regulator
MAITAVQIRMARAALGWGVRELAEKAELATDTISRAEQGGFDITTKTWGALQRALEEAGIEFLPETNSVAFHKNPSEAVIYADPAMPLGVRRGYAR